MATIKNIKGKIKIMGDKTFKIKEIEKCIKEFEDQFREKADTIRSRISSEKSSASEYYICDLEGYLRGVLQTGDWAAKFFKGKLLGK